VRIGIALPLEVEDRMALDATRHGHEVILRCGDAQELASMIDKLHPEAVIVAADQRYLSQQVLAVCDEKGVSVIALVTDDVSRRHAASLGLFETVDATCRWPAIQLVLDGASRPPRNPVQSAGPAASALTPAAERLSTGTVIAVWGPSGAPGRTSLAIAIASEIAALGHSVALADVDTHGASIAPALGMLDEAPGFAAACRLAGAGRLTGDELERVAQRYESPLGAFWILTGIGRPSRWPELSSDRVAATVAACRHWVEYTVLDTGSSLENDEEISSDLHAPRRNAATVTAVHEADHVVAVGSADPVGLSRFLRSHAELREAAARAEVTVVMNRVRASAIGMNPNVQVAQTLSRFGGIQNPVLIPHDLAAFDSAILSGRTLADSAPRSAARTAIRHFLNARLLPEPAHAERLLRLGLGLRHVR